MLNPSPSKLKWIEERLRTLHGKPVLLRLVDNAQDGEDVSGLLEDLQEAVNGYMVCLWPMILSSALTRTTDGATNGDLRSRM